MTEYPLPEVKTVTERFYGMLGLARRAGKTVPGTEMICTQMREKKKPVLVLLSCKASVATQDRLHRKCAYYRVPLIRIEVSTEELAHRMGYSGETAAVAVTDEGFAHELTAECK